MNHHVRPEAKSATVEQCQACDHTGKVSAGAYLRPEVRPVDPEQRTCCLCFGRTAPPAQKYGVRMVEPMYLSSSPANPDAVVVRGSTTQVVEEPWTYFWECAKCHSTYKCSEYKFPVTMNGHGPVCMACGYAPMSILGLRDGDVHKFAADPSYLTKLEWYHPVTGEPVRG